VLTPLCATGASAPVDKPTYHPAFAADAARTTSLLRQQVQRYEDKFRELYVVLGVSGDTPFENIPALVEQRLAGRTAVQEGH
jgi:hypothetical protein